MGIIWDLSKFDWQAIGSLVSALGLCVAAWAAHSAQKASRIAIEIDKRQAMRAEAAQWRTYAVAAATIRRQFRKLLEATREMTSSIKMHRNFLIGTQISLIADSIARIDWVDVEAYLRDRSSDVALDLYAAASDAISDWETAANRFVLMADALGEDIICIETIESDLPEVSDKINSVINVADTILRKVAEISQVTDIS